jgi:phage terminase small subunit
MSTNRKGLKMLVKRKRQFRDAMAKCTESERKVVDGLLSGLSKTEALRQAGYSESVVRSRTSTVIGRSRVQTALLIALQDIASQDLVSIRLSEGLEAETEYKGKGTGNADLKTRLEYIKEINKLRGEYPDKTVIHESETYEERIERLRGDETDVIDV